MKFRALRADGNGLVYGNLNELSDGMFILENDQSGNIQEPEYHYSGMGCGLEDRNIKDRYKAMEHGWECAIERQNELLPLFIEVLPETVGMFSGYTDKLGKEIYGGIGEKGGDRIVILRPYRTTQTHVGDNIPNGSYTEPMEPGIKVIEGDVLFINGSFTLKKDKANSDFDDSPLPWEFQEWDLESIKDAISWRQHSDDIFDWFKDPEEGDLKYLIEEVAKVKDSDELIRYLSGCEIIGNQFE